MKKSALLINEPPLQVLPSLAVSIGLNEAIIIQQLHYWLENPKVGVERDGSKWIFNTYEEWQENFPFWSVSTIQRIFTSLEKDGLVIAEQLDAKKHDMRKFYRINYDKLCMMEDVNLTLSSVSNKDDVNSNTETTSKNSQDIDKVSEWLKMAQFPGAKKEIRVDNILSYLGETLRRNTGGKDWEDFAKYIDTCQQKEGWKVETFVSWLVSQRGYDPQYWSVKKMREFYPMAFTQNKPQANDGMKPL